MALQTRVKVAKPDAPKMHGLDRDTLVRLYRTMYLSRKLDDREIQLKRQNKIYFQISSAGHEAVTAAAGLLLRPGVDWIYPYYRDRALCLMLGVTPLETLLQAVGAKDDPSSGGRQMPSHWGHPEWNIVNRSSCTGTQFVQAVGAAEATMYYQHRAKALAKAKKLRSANTSATKTTKSSTCLPATAPPVKANSGNRSTPPASKNFRCFISSKTTATPSPCPSKCRLPAAAFPNWCAVSPGLQVAECDGTDPLESYAACRDAIQYCRERRGPALVHAHVTRPYSHSLSDDEKLYKSAEEREREAHRDPLSKFSLFLVREGVLDQKQIEALEAEVDNEVRDAADQALLAAEPSDRFHPDECLFARC